jgi:hypothetical protein
MFLAGSTIVPDNGSHRLLSIRHLNHKASWDGERIVNTHSPFSLAGHAMRLFYG